jgi:adenine-specific DNA-methyltransferase
MSGGADRLTALPFRPKRSATEHLTYSASRMTSRFANVTRRRRILRAAAEELRRCRLRGVAAFARAERLSAREAAFRLTQLAHFDRAAELRVDHAIRAAGLVRAVRATDIVDEELCAWLAGLRPKAAGPIWSAVAYSALLIARERRDRGQFFTPEPIAQAMAHWAIRSKRARVLDPGSGPGQLLASAQQRLRTLGARRASSQLVGVELSLLAPAFAALALAPAGGIPRVDQADFLTTFRARSRSFDAIVANPPYSRHHALSRAYKEQIGKLADRLTGEHVHRSAGIYVHFLLRSLSLLKDGGRLAFLTPREFFDARYGSVVKAHLLKQARLRGLVVFDPAATRAFEGVMTTSAITLLERGKPDRAAVRVVHVRRIPSAVQLAAALAPDAQMGERAWGWVEDVAYERVAAASRWSSLLPGHVVTADRKGQVPLGDLVRVKRGIATGANRFFVLSKADANANSLKNGSLRPAIARAHLVNGARITKNTFTRWSGRGERVWLLDIRHKMLTPAERAYLRAGVAQKLDARTLCRMRTPWYRMERRDPPPILVTYMSKDAPRFVRNDAGVVPLNVFHGLYPKDLNKRQVATLMDHLNSEAFRKKMGRAARTYGAGLVKIEPRELSTVTVPDVRRAPGRQ